jgi:hypothetical protein
MAELGILASGVQLAERTFTTARKVWQYSKDVKEAPEEARKMRDELGLIVNFLKQVTIISEESFTPLLKGYFEELSQGFEEVWTDLSKRIAPEKTATITGRLLWPFTTDETDKLIKKVERLKGTYNLALHLMSCSATIKTYHNTYVA